MKTTSRIISALLTLVMLLSIVSAGIVSTGAASPSAALSVENVSAVPGSTVEVDVEIKNNPGIIGASLKLSYGEGLTLTDAAAGDAWDVLSMTKPGKFESPCTFTWDALEISPDQIKDGVILKLTFKVAEDATSSTALPINIAYEYGDVADNNMNFVSLDITNGHVTVIDYTPGDVDNNGKVNSLDVIYLRRYIAGGYDVVINTLAANVNGDTKINTLDTIMIRRFIAGGYTDSEGNPLVLLPSPIDHTHKLTHVSRKEPTNTETGIKEHWYCSGCGKYFSDSAGKTEVKHEDLIIPIPVLDGIPITYHLYDGDNYLESVGVNNPNPDYYLSDAGLILANPVVSGYKFEGWYDGAGANGDLIKKIPVGETKEYDLYARWSQISYDVTYKLYQTPLKPISDEKFLHYTTGKGLPDLPNPTIYNYVFLGWYTDDGKEVKSIPAGTTGNITLNAFWTSKRNIAKSVGKLDDPYILEDTDNGVIYFTYELGTIENIPLSDNIWTIQSVSGLAQQKSETYTTSLTQGKAEAVSNTISNSTVDSGTWTLSEGWNNTTSVTEEWAEQHGMTVEEANERCTTSSNTFSLTDSNGGSNSHTATDGTTTVDYNSQNYTHGNSAEFGAKVSGKYTNSTEVSASAKAGYGPFSAEAGVKNTSTFEIGAEISGKYEQHQETNEHTGTDTTKVNTTVDANTSTWNSSRSASSTNTASQRSTVSKAVSDIISNKKGYGRSYSTSGENSQTKGYSNTESNSVNSSSTLTWSSVETKTVTNTYSTDGKSEGCYRLVIAGKAHVFGVVGYDVATNSYFTYTFSVMDDEQYEFLDYAPDLNFNDCENGVLPFEIPFFVYEYSTAATVRTNGLVFRTNSTSKTATVTGYTGDSLEVTVPNYITSGGVAYKVTTLSSNAFAGKDIRSIVLSKFIKEIPKKAFKDCSSLEQISGYYNVIGDEAFSGCTSLENYNITLSTKAIGENAFSGVPQIVANVISEDYALEYSDQNTSAAKELTQEIINSAVNSGANKVIISLADIIDDCEISINAPDMDYFELQGDKDKTFSNLTLSSNANETVLKKLTINKCSRTPLTIASEKLTLDTVHINSNGYCLLISDNAEIDLVRDNVLNSGNAKAIVCKDPVFTSSVTNGVLGYLEISGNVYVCGTLSGDDNIEVNNGNIIFISEDEFAKYIKGSYEVTFDPNGGTVGTTSKTVYYGETYGELPTPNRSNCEFLGWYLNDTKITSDTVLSVSEDLVLKARWQSGWVLSENLPSDGEVNNDKWSYTEREYSESGSSSKDGWTKYDTKRTSWGPWSDWVNYNPSNGVRDVTYEQYRSGWGTKQIYVFYWWSSSYNGNPARAQISGYPNYYTMEIDYYPSNSSQRPIGLEGSTFKRWDGYNWYMCWYDHEYSTTDYNKPLYSDHWKYRDPIYTYYYYRDVDKVSTSEITAGGNISNVKHWVKYIVK